MTATLDDVARRKAEPSAEQWSRRGWTSADVTEVMTTRK